MNKTSKSARVNIITLGCSKNLVDSEKLMGQLKAAGVSIVHEDKLQPGDTVVINTCGFIHDAREESINTILEYAREKETGKLSALYVMGCLSQRYRSELQENIPEVDGFFGVNELPEIINQLGADYKKELIGERMLTTPSHYAYLKISEGCNHRCAFCAIPLIRGGHKSIPLEQLLGEARKLANKGVKELILIAQDLTYYGMDIYKKRSLAQLLRALSDLGLFQWIRLHYAYPFRFPLDVLEVMREREDICNYMDIPLQHISDNLLHTMKRGAGQKETEDLIQKIRKEVPGVALRTTFMVGFPGETEADFQTLKDFVSRMRFERMGVFTYSHEENTPAYASPETVPEEVKQARMEELMAIQQEISAQINRDKIGLVLPLIIDRLEGDYLVGRTEYDSPEVDNEVLIKGSQAPGLIGQILEAKITAASDFDLYAKLIS